MPKIIENLQEKLLVEAKRQVMECGYASMTIRSVAKACGVGVGTVYNYFPSKDMLIASFMLEDWLICQRAIADGCSQATQPKEALESIYRELNCFINKYNVLFQDEAAGMSFSSSFQQRHKQLRAQIAQPLKSICKKACSRDEMQTHMGDCLMKVEPEFLADFLAESMLTWTIAGYEFEQIAGILLKLL